MNMSRAALPPIQPPVYPADRKHPDYAAYSRYRSACNLNLIEASRFDDWLAHRELERSLAEWENHPQLRAFQNWMWANQGGTPGRNPAPFPENFKLWLDGARW